MGDEEIGQLSAERLLTIQGAIAGFVRTGLRVGRRWTRTALEQVAQEMDRIGDPQDFVVVRVAGISTGGRSSNKQVEKDPYAGVSP